MSRKKNEIAVEWLESKESSAKKNEALKCSVKKAEALKRRHGEKASGADAADCHVCVFFSTVLTVSEMFSPSSYKDAIHSVW